MDNEVKKMIRTLRRCAEGGSCTGCELKKQLGCVEQLVLMAADMLEETAMMVPPDSHGDLIDRQQVLDEILDLAQGSRVLAGWGNLRLLYTLVNTAETVIPATKKKEAQA